MTKYMNVVASNEQETYVSVVFTEHEEIAVRYQRLLKEFDTKLENRLIELNKFSEDQLKSDITLNKNNAVKDYNQRKQYLGTYAKQAEDLRNLILSFSKVNKPSEFFSKQILKKYVGHEFLTEGGYPNDKFRIELLARAIRTIEVPNDADNQKQLGLIHTILPEGTSKKLPILLGVAAFVLAGVALTGLMLGTGPAAIIPIAIALTMFSAGFFGSFFAFQAIPIVQEKHEIYKKYKDTIPNISKNLQFFTQSEMEKHITQKKAEDNSVHVSQSSTIAAL